MIVYLDTSVVLRRFMRQGEVVRGWGRWERAYAGVLVRTEFMRTVERLRLDGSIRDEERVALHRHFQVLWEVLHRVPLTDGIVERAGQPFPTVLGTLDALHLASALAIREIEGQPVVVLTHDVQLGRAALASGLDVGGV